MSPPPLIFSFGQKSYSDLVALSHDVNARIRAALESVASSKDRVRTGPVQRGLLTSFRTSFMLRRGGLRGVEISVNMKPDRLLLEVDASPPLMRTLLCSIGILVTLTAFVVLFPFLVETFPAGRAGLPAGYALAITLGFVAMIPAVLLVTLVCEPLSRRLFPTA